VGLVLLVLLGLVAGWHLTQGTTGVGFGDLVRLLGGGGDPATWDVLAGSRLPRMLAGVVVGVALGAGGAVLASLARNALAAPDTLAVTAGGYFAVTLVTALGLSLPWLADGLVAFVGALAAAAAVLVLAGVGAASTTRLILAGSALALALDSVAGGLLLVFRQETTGLYAWGKGTLSQTGLDGVVQMGPVVLVALAGVLLLSRQLDLLALGDDAASSLGVPVRGVRVTCIVLAVLMCSASVTLAGPLAFVGLCAPAATRLLRPVVPALGRHLALVPLSALVGALIVLVSDAAMRAVMGEEAALSVPTGVTTTLLGAVVLVALARRANDAGPTRRPASARPGGSHSGRRFAIVVTLLVLGFVGALVLGLLAGHRWLLLGDVTNWLSGNAVTVIDFAMTERSPRVVAALAGGAALALAGTVIQAVARNPLAEPGLLGITGGAGVGAVIVVTADPYGAASAAAIGLAAVIGALAAFGLVYALTWRGGLDSDRLVLIGIGVWAGTGALSSLLIIRSDPWNTPRIFTWMSGSTWERGWDQVVPVLVALAVCLPVMWAAHRQLDLLALDDDTPRLVGIRVERFRLVALLSSAVLTATAVAAVGVVGFLGLVAPHAARGLVAGRHVRVIPVAVLVGAVLLSVADTIGRSLLAPDEIPAGLIVAAVGAPYFLYLLWRSRA
jgi:iron complex transport system permease protein